MSASIPDDLIFELVEQSNGGLPTGWSRYIDRDGDVWDLTGESFGGDRVMMPHAGDMSPMLRRDVELTYGPLSAESGA